MSTLAQRFLQSFSHVFDPGILAPKVPYVRGYGVPKGSHLITVSARGFQYDCTSVLYLT